MSAHPRPDALTDVAATRPLSSLQSLAQCVRALAQAADADAAAALAVRATCDATGADSSALIRTGDSVRLAAVCGPLTEGFATLDAGQWEAVDAALDDLVSGGVSPGTAVVIDALRYIGVRGAAAVALSARGSRIGFLVAASREPAAFEPAALSRLEIVAAQAVSSLMLWSPTPAEGDEERDPVTGLAQERSFQRAIAAALSAPTPGRRVAALLLDVAHGPSARAATAAVATDRAMVEAATLLATALRDEDALFRIGVREFAAVVLVHDEAEAAAIAHRLWSAVRGLPTARVSVGAAVAAAGEKPAAVLARADDALYAIKSAGGDGVRLAAPASSRLVTGPWLPGHLLDVPDP